MNGRVLRLFADYLQRTIGVWLLLGVAHVIQVTAFWATHVERLPLLGVAIASLTYFAAFESPLAAMRTLPLSRKDIALFRWWAGVGAPGVVLIAGTSLSWLVSGDNGWPRPAQFDVTMYALVYWAMLSILAFLPLPTRVAGRPNQTRFGVMWTCLVAVGFYGLPIGNAARPLMLAVVVIGLALSVVSYVRARMGRTTSLSLSSKPLAARRTRESTSRWSASSSHGALRGWMVFVVDVARGTAVLSFVAVILVSAVRWAYPTLAWPALTGPALAEPTSAGPALVTSSLVVWLFVSAVAVAASLQTRRWMNAVRSLRLLPIGDYRLAAILYVLSIAPGVITCMIATAACHASPHWGLNVPAYMLTAFLVAPVTMVPWQWQRHASSAFLNSIQQWTPLIQQVAWPLWVGSLCSLGRLHLISAGFMAYLLFIAVGFAIAGYSTLLAGIRLPQALEQSAGPLADPA